ncbi:MAG TPA: hypothetical protein VLY66_00035 [Candidatus Eisenbacteria bacterium]|nr:hypothetical protein [Candidatus Eisenbacteria bacterium]
MINKLYEIGKLPTIGTITFHQMTKIGIKQDPHHEDILDIVTSFIDHTSLYFVDKSLVGYVLRVKQFADGSTDIVFVTADDEELELHYFADLSKKGELTKEMAQILAGTLDSDTWAEITFDDTGSATSVELEVVSEEDLVEEE